MRMKLKFEQTLWIVQSSTGCLKKTSFFQNWPWQILLMIMRNPLSFFMTNTLSALAFMLIIALLTIAGSICATSLEILQQNLPGAQAESSWYPSSCGTPLQERIAEADWIAALEASLFWNHFLGQKNTLPSLKKQQSNLGQIHLMYSHIYLLSEKGLVFYLYLQKFHMDFSLSRVIFTMANFDKRKFFLRHPVHYICNAQTKCKTRFHCQGMILAWEWMSTFQRKPSRC